MSTASAGGPDGASPTALISVADYERVALATLTAEARGYIEGGAADELTLNDNAAAWQRLALRPRMLAGTRTLDLSVELLGVPRPHPVIIAPTAFQSLAHPDGEIGIARAAAQTDAVMCVSTLASSGAEAVAAAIPDAARWFQLYAFRDPGVTQNLVDAAAAHGYEAIVVTVDRPVLGLRERELRTGVRNTSNAGPSSAAGGRGAPPADYSALINTELSWPDIAALAARSPLPILVKGVLTGEDAQLSAEHGAAGVIVSNHGGRQLDTVLSGADALPGVVDAVDGRIDVLVDGGIRRGTDIVKALALGARAVLVGRPLTWGLAVDGAAGAQRVLEILLTELRTALVLVGCPRARDLHPGFVTPAPWAARPE